MNKKEQKAAQRAREEDVVLTKVLWWILGAVVLEALLLLLNKVYVYYPTEQINLVLALRSAFQVLSIALPVCASRPAQISPSVATAMRKTSVPSVLA